FLRKQESSALSRHSCSGFARFGTVHAERSLRKQAKSKRRGVLMALRAASCALRALELLLNRDKLPFVDVLLLYRIPVACSLDPNTCQGSDSQPLHLVCE